MSTHSLRKVKAKLQFTPKNNAARYFIVSLKDALFSALMNLWAERRAVDTSWGLYRVMVQCKGLAALALG